MDTQVVSSVVAVVGTLVQLPMPSAMSIVIPEHHYDRWSRTLARSTHRPALCAARANDPTARRGRAESRALWNRPGRKHCDPGEQRCYLGNRKWPRISGDGHGMTASNSADRPGAPLSVYDMRIHVLNAADTFDLLNAKANGM